jgi:hypothetical protein
MAPSTLKLITMRKADMTIFVRRNSGIEATVSETNPAATPRSVSPETNVARLHVKENKPSCSRMIG